MPTHCKGTAHRPSPWLPTSLVELRRTRRPDKSAGPTVRMHWVLVSSLSSSVTSFSEFRVFRTTISVILLFVQDFPQVQGRRTSRIYGHKKAQNTCASEAPKAPIGARTT